MKSNIILKKINNEIGSIIINEPKTYNSLSFKNLTDLLREPALSSVCELLARVAERHFQQALELIKSCDSDAAQPAVLMLQVYHRILKRLIWFGWTPPRRHISLTYMTKLWIMIRYGIL